MSSERLEIAASRMVLGLVHSEDLVCAGAAALEDGCDSPGLRALAGLSLTEAAEARAAFDRALVELKIAIPSKRDAVMRLARATAKEILCGNTSANEGAKQIWELTLRVPDEHLPHLDTFVYAASEWDDRPEDRRALYEGITAAAKDLVRN